MPEQTFRSPNFFEREIDLSAPTPASPTGVPACVIGTANKGPAFVPVTVGNFDEFRARFGDLDPMNPAPYGVNEFLKHRQALTYLRLKSVSCCQKLHNTSVPTFFIVNGNLPIKFDTCR
jgi:hypothetical protein